MFRILFVTGLMLHYQNFVRLFQLLLPFLLIEYIFQKSLFPDNCNLTGPKFFSILSKHF